MDRLRFSKLYKSVFHVSYNIKSRNSIPHSFDNLSLCFLCQVESMPPLRVSPLYKMFITERAGIVYCSALQEPCMMILLKKAAYLLASATASSMERSIHLEKTLPMNVKNGKDHGCLHTFL